MPFFLKEEDGKRTAPGSGIKSLIATCIAFIYNQNDPDR
jgi:hypothetical protein